MAGMRTEWQVLIETAGKPYRPPEGDNDSPMLKAQRTPGMIAMRARKVARHQSRVEAMYETIKQLGEATRQQLMSAHGVSQTTISEMTDGLMAKGRLKVRKVGLANVWSVK